MHAESVRVHSVFLLYCLPLSFLSLSMVYISTSATVKRIILKQLDQPVSEHERFVLHTHISVI